RPRGRMRWRPRYRGATRALYSRPTARGLLLLPTGLTDRYRTFVVYDNGPAESQHLDWLQRAVFIRDLDIRGMTRIPSEADSPLLAHANTVLPLAITFEGFELVTMIQDRPNQPARLR